LVHTYRLQLSRGEDVIDPETFSGSIPQLRGVAPRVRVGRGRWFNLLWLIPIGIVLLIVSVCGREGIAQ
jgi:methionine sulfoxide reductase catalytic subunit